MSTHHPSASEVSMGAGFTDFGPYRVRVNPFQNHTPHNKWEVLDREDTDGLRSMFDSFSTFRDAVRCAVSLHREWERMKDIRKGTSETSRIARLRMFFRINKNWVMVAVCGRALDKDKEALEICEHAWDDFHEELS